LSSSHRRLLPKADGTISVGADATDRTRAYRELQIEDRSKDMYETVHRMRPISLAVAVAAGVVIGGIVLSVALWILGMVAGFIFALVRLAMLVALAGAVVYGVRFLFGRGRCDR